MSNACCICRQTKTGQAFILTPEEREALGPQAPEEVFYCSACLKVMRDREAGAQLLKGLYEMRLREIGVADPSEAAYRLYVKLVGPKH